jgi:hypothetical protein
MGDALALRERNEAIGWPVGFDAHHRGAETLRQADVLLQGVSARPSAA